MCMFSRPVISVNNTRIFARHSGKHSGNGTQFLAYQMEYESEQTNAMILPVPIKRPASETSLKFIDLSGYEKFFNDLDRGFPFHEGLNLGCGSKSTVSAHLKVFKVGNYIASFVPTLSDFNRLAPEFNLPAETWEKVPFYQSFGFAVFQLAAGTLRPHPMAFEFSSDREALFFPTVHIHDGEVHADEAFDHILYLQHAGIDSEAYGYVNSDVEDRSTGLIRSKFIASEFCDVESAAGLVVGNLLVHRKILRGVLPNQDVEIAASGNPLKTTLNPRPWLWLTPWLILLGAIGWFFQRRSKLKRIA